MIACPRVVLTGGPGGGKTARRQLVRRPHYCRWPDARRQEALAQAAETDRLCTHAWSGHLRYILIENAGRD